MSEPVVSQVHTACKGCVHAIYDGLTQTGCRFGRLDKFRDSGAEIIEVYDIDGHEFFVINNRMCTWKRNAEWLLKNGIRTKERQGQLMREEAALPFHLIVDDASSIEDIQKTVEYINAMKEKPIEATFVRKIDSFLRPPEIIVELKNLSCKWNLSNYADDGMEIDDILHSVKTPYFCYVKPGYEIPVNLFTKVNDMVHYDLFRFAYILPAGTEKHCTIAQTQIYKTLNIKLEYLHLLEKEESCKNMIAKLPNLYQINH